MFCLFRNSLIHPALNLYVMLFSVLSALGWLYFTFIEKSLASKLFAGEALIVDLVFGLPLVLMMGVVIYATVYWTIKVILMLLVPQAIVLKSDAESVLTEQLDDEYLQDLEETHGKAYWHKDDSDASAPSKQAGTLESNSAESKPPQPKE
ncbi:MAG: hypothetical protein GXO35_05750 [Gammaproteobacteria bacterium]|nr:hypothetical protein [Gammaproteobacteria bacterium]